jgi:hypothetical protein
MCDFSVHPLIALDTHGIWLYVDGVRVCNLDDMTIYDFDSRITIEGGLVFEVLPPLWASCLRAIGLSFS